MDNTEIQIKLTEHDGKFNAQDEKNATLEKRVGDLENRDELLTDLRIELGKLQMQIKITWVLLMLVISGLVGVAFSAWKGVL